MGKTDTIIDKDGNITTDSIHIFRGTNRNINVGNYPCPNCNSLTYLGMFIPTVSVLTADYYGASFQCHNLNCDPVYEEDVIDWDDEGNECEPRTVYDLVDSGAYWDAEDEFYYTPQCPRE
jgi:hypothetical protein